AAPAHHQLPRRGRRRQDAAADRKAPRSRPALMASSSTEGRVSEANEARGSAEAKRGLDPVALAKLQNLEVRARTVVEGALSGLHRSRHHGASVEFAEHKEYAPGDEIKHIDWKAYGKFDRYYIKRFEEETELKAYLVLDSSASMGYAGAGPSKLDY